MSFDKYIKVRLIDSAGLALEIISPDPTTGTVRDSDFRIDKSHRRDPDKAEVTLYNLGTTEGNFALDSAEQIEIYASAEEPTPALLFKGEITDVSPSWSDDMSTHETHIYAEDSKSILRTRVISQSFDAGTPLAAVFSALASAGDLQLDSAVSGKLVDPFAVLGPVRDAIAQCAVRHGYRYQIVDHKLVIRGVDEPTSLEVPLVSAETGLIGVPTSELDKKVVKVNVRSKLNPKLVAGGLFVLKTNSTRGSRKAPIKSGTIYWIERVVHVNGVGQAMTTDVVSKEY